MKPLRTVAFAALLLMGCQSEPEPLPPAPEQPAPQAAPEPEPPEPPEGPLLSADAELFWFGKQGAPPPLGSKAGPTGPRWAPPQEGEAQAEDETPYVLDTGDVLEFRIPEDKTYDREVTVAPDGTITLDLVGAVKARGRTLAQIREELAASFSKYLRKATPGLFLKQARAAAQQVVVVGPVDKAGRVELTGQQSLLDVLGDVGYGGKPDHQRDRITILRSGRALTVWSRDVLSLRDPRWNLRLRTDDVVVIHLPEQATVAGEVARPGSLDLPTLGAMPIQEAIARSGGVTEKADLRMVRIVRDWGQRIESVDLNAVLFAGARAPDPLVAGDTLTIPAGKPTGVYVFGMVDTPGLQRYNGRVSLAAAVAQASPKQFGALLDEAKVVRGWPQNPEVIAVDLDRLLFEHDEKLDIELRDGDVVYIPESVLSDVLDVVARALGPLAAPAQAAGTVLTGAAAGN